MKIIHCSDIHLGSSLTSHFDRETAEKRNNELTLSFGRLAQYAKDNSVTAVIIAGDLFDRKTIKISLKESIIKIIKDAPLTDFLYLKGNHDKDTPFPSAEDIPDNLKVFGRDWTSFDYGEITVAGVCLDEQNYRGVYDSLQLKTGKTNIVVMHGGENFSAKNNAPDTISLRKLAGKNIDYLALGDYHSYKKEKLDLRGVYCYSGCLEGRGFDETGEKGFVLLECENGKTLPHFVPFANRLVHEIEVNISNAVTTADIEREAETATSDIPQYDLVRVLLTGECPPDTLKNLVYLQQKLKTLFYYAEVKDKTRLKIDPSAYADGVSLKSEFIRLVLADSTLTNQQRDKIIGCGIAALKGEALDL